MTTTDTGLHKQEMGDDMQTTRLNSVAFLLLIPLLTMLCEKMPDSWLDGPFNHNISGDFFDDKNVVPNTLYYNNNTNYYTIWDEDQEKYVTYDRRGNFPLQTVVFNAPELTPEGYEQTGRVRLLAGYNNVVRGPGEPRGVVIAGTMAVPASHLDDEGMRIQAEQGCDGCHIM